ncbi:uncharacterized protein LOC110117412 [Athalia rosae]|uniref:uncharacterized protein LOC110117412 n=1 Tax=Athalia rosae TaxID=37344 RepID=UPI0020347D48|nr:uncharacterized protein LOC110117412 [Athalia rosae]
MIVKRFNTMGDLSSAARRPVVQQSKRLDEETRLNIYLAFEEGSQSASKVAQEFGVSKSSVLNILHEAGYRSYKFHRHQERMHHDAESRMAFCGQMIEELIANEGLPSRICFTDESTVLLRGRPNRQNVRVWSASNPHLVV